MRTSIRATISVNLQENGGKKSRKLTILHSAPEHSFFSVRPIISCLLNNLIEACDGKIKLKKFGTGIENNSAELLFKRFLNNYRIHIPTGLFNAPSIFQAHILPIGIERKKGNATPLLMYCSSAAVTPTFQLENLTECLLQCG